MSPRRLAKDGIALALAAVSLAVLAPGAGAVPFGNSLKLDGVNDYANIPDNTTLDLGDTEGEDFTIESFFYVPDQLSEANQVIFYKTNAYILSINFNTATPDAVSFTFSPAGTLSNTASLTAGWHHVAAVFDNEWSASNDRAAIYLDGAELAFTSAFELTPGINNTSNLLSVGANSGAVPFNGWLEEARFSDSVRYSGSYTVPSSAFLTDANTRALWHFDEPACSTGFLDSSGNGNLLAGQNGAQTGLQGAPAPTLQFDTSSYLLAESGGSATITVTRSGDPAPTVGVNHATSNGTAEADDYTDTDGTLSFGCGETSKTFEVPVTSDTSFEGDETLNLTLSDPTGGASLGSPSAATLTITDDDTPVLQFSSVAFSAGESTGSATITVTRGGGDPTVPVGVSYAATAGTAAAGQDFTAVTGSLSFAGGDTEETFSVPLLGDTAIEGNETVGLALNTPTGGAVLGIPAAAVLTIIDDDSPLPPPAQCADGVDNDGDGKVDFPADPGCSSPADNDESDPAPPGGTTPPTTDTTPPSPVLSGPKTQRAGGSIKVGVGCPDEACTAAATGTVNVPGASAARRFRLGKASAQLPKGGQATLRLKVPRKALRAIKRALRKRKKVAAKVTVSVRDAVGNTTTRARTIRLKK